MPKKKRETNVEKLASESARAYATVVGMQASLEGISFPLGDDEVGKLLNNTISGLQAQGRLDWSRLSTLQRQDFVNAWTREMDSLGIRA